MDYFIIFLIIIIMKTLETLFSGSKYCKSLDFADADNNIKITYTAVGSKKI